MKFISKVNLKKRLIADKIFKAYDIRGVYPNEINEDIVFYIARAYVQFLKKRANKSKLKIVISSDFRLSSPKLKKVFIKGLLSEGIEVIDIGFSTTPMNYFAINYLKTDGGAMITASHNPKEYNGIKLSFKKAIPIGENSGLKEIKNIFLKFSYLQKLHGREVFVDKQIDGQNKEQSEKTKGKLIKKNIVNQYVDFLIKISKIPNFKFYIPNSKLKIIVDCGNGAVGYILSKILKNIGIKYYPLYFKPDGRFPNRDPNPLKENALNKLKKEILKRKFDLGIAFDADGDRIFFIDENNQLIRSDFIFGLMAKNLLEKKSKAKIIGDIRLTKAVKEFVENNGGIFKFSKVGHVFFKDLMRKEKAELGGEFSGHYYFKDFFFCDSGILAMLKILKILSFSNQKISEMIKPFKKYFQSGEINFEVKDKTKIIKRVKNYFKNLKIQKLKIYNFDGLNIEMSDFWVNLRPSNTESLLNLEAKTKTILNKNLKLLTKLIK